MLHHLCFPRVFVALILTASVLAAEAPSSSVQRREYRCGPGDILAVTVFEVEELSGKFTVGADGKVRLPLIGAVDAGGRTVAEIERSLTESYAGRYLRDPQISVAVEEFRSQPVSVVGAVKEAGVYQLEGRKRLVEVIALAGGLHETAGGTVTVSRETPDGSHDIQVSVEEMLRLGSDERTNPWIEPLDVVRVETAGIVYVLGSVARPGGFPIKEQEQMTALRAMSLAEGSKPTAALQKARIIRQQGAEKIEIDISLKDVLDGKVPDPVLLEDDILFVPDSAAKGALRRGAEAAIQMATGLVIWRR